MGEKGERGMVEMEKCRSREQNGGLNSNGTVIGEGGEWREIELIYLTYSDDQ